MSAAPSPRRRDVAADAEALRALHVPGRPLLLANIWDPPTARVVEAAGLPAIATASAAVAPANGYEDHGKLPPDIAFAAVRRITDAVTLPVTADLEDGYGLSADELVRRLIVAGACGLNFEDTDSAANRLIDMDRQATRIAAIKAAGQAQGVNVVINARVDVHIHNRPLEEGLSRAQAYLAAGADCIYPILLTDVAGLRAYVGLGPVNALYRPGGASLRELAQAGVARLSVGPSLFRLALKKLQMAVDAFRRLDDQAMWA